MNSFTPKQCELFEHRFEEGYDLLHDTDYVCWLKLYHPEAVTKHPENNSHSPSVSSSEKSSSITPKTPQSQPTPSTPLGDSTSIQKQSCISKYLTTPCSSNASSKPAPKARLLTSADALAILEEKEKKKKEAAEEKERRKKEREEKKMQKEQEREEKKKLRETEKKRKTTKKTEKDKPIVLKSIENLPRQANKRKPPDKPKPTTSKKAKVSAQPPEDENVDSNVCCACFGSYEDDVLEGSGAVWISCACGRWLHEDCVEECKEDDQGNDRMCPLCVDVLTS